MRLMTSEIIWKNSRMKPASTKNFDGQTISSQYVSATQLIATVPASLLANDRTAAVWVLTVSGQSNTVNVVIQPTGPRITAFTPAAGPLGILVTITGTRFTVDGPAAVRFNGEPAVVASVSDTQITAIVPPRATTGPISVTSRSRGRNHVPNSRSQRITVLP